MFLSLKFFQRDAKIEALQTMLEKQHSEKEKQLVDSLNNIINSHHQETTDKLEKLKETAHHQADNQQQLLDHHRQQREIMDIHHQQYQNMYSVRHKEIKNGFVTFYLWAKDIDSLLHPRSIILNFEFIYLGEYKQHVFPH